MMCTVIMSVRPDSVVQKNNGKSCDVYRYPLPHLVEGTSKLSELHPDPSTAYDCSTLQKKVPLMFRGAAIARSINKRVSRWLSQIV